MTVLDPLDEIFDTCLWTDARCRPSLASDFIDEYLKPSLASDFIDEYLKLLKLFEYSLHR